MRIGTTIAGGLAGLPLAIGDPAELEKQLLRTVASDEVRRSLGGISYRSAQQLIRGAAKTVPGTTRGYRAGTCLVESVRTRK